VLDALNQAVWQRKPYGAEGLIHHSDRGSQYLSIKYTERLAEAQIDASVGTVGDSYDNARCAAPCAETIIGLFKVPPARRKSSTASARGNQCARSSGKLFAGRLVQQPPIAQFAVRSTIRYVTPAEAEEAFYEKPNAHDKAA